MVEILIPYVLGSAVAGAAIGVLIGWVAKALTDDTTVYDTAGNVAAKACVECHQFVESDKDLTMFNRCWSCYSREVDGFFSRVRASSMSAPNPHTDLIVNTMSPLGFLAVQLRLSGDYANDRGVLDDAGCALDVAVEALKKDLTPCADCGQINGNHRVTCADLGDMLKMDWRAKEPMGESTDKDDEDAER